MVNMEKIRFLQCLSKQYPTIDSAATEIINLQSILNLPKGTEHFKKHDEPCKSSDYSIFKFL